MTVFLTLMRETLTKNRKFEKLLCIFSENFVIIPLGRSDKTLFEREYVVKGLAKTVKITALILLVGLALVGAYSLLKRTPQIDISREDAEFLQQAGINATSKASDAGLSGVHGAAVGVPEFNMDAGATSLPPGSFGKPSDTPPLSFGTATGKTAAETEAPAYSPVAATSNTAIPALSVAPAFSATPPSTPSVIDIKEPNIVPAPPAPNPVSAQPPLSPQPVIPQPIIKQAEVPTAPAVSSWDSNAIDIQKNTEKNTAFAPVSPNTGSAADSVRENKESNVLRRLPNTSEMTTANTETETTGGFAQELPKQYSPQVYHLTAIRPHNETDRIAGDPIISFGQTDPPKIPAKYSPLKDAPKSATSDVMPFVATDAVDVNSVPKRETAFAAPAVEVKPILPDYSEIVVPPVRESVERFVQQQELAVASNQSAQIRTAFVELSKLYNKHPELTQAERERMLPLLDKLALSVIYSRSSHLLEPSYTVKPTDTVAAIAAKFTLSEALLMKINGLTGAKPLESGAALKILVGPFDAKISTKRSELTLILGGLYAGRFTVSLGERVKGLTGDFYVNAKTNSWDEKTLTLNNGITLRGLDRGQPNDSLATTVRFAEQNAQELFDILTERSVIIFEE
jgi:LysM repeat protein